MEKITPLVKPNFFIPIPRDIVCATDISDKRIICYSYFFMNMTIDDVVLCSRDYLIRWCNYVPSSRKNKKTNMSLNDQFFQVIQWMQNNGYFLSLMDECFKSGDIFACDINREKFLLNENFTRIYDFELKKIKNEYGNFADVVLLVLSYLRINMWRNNENTKNTKPEMINRHFNNISDELEISVFLVKKAVAALCDIGIIKIFKPTKFKDKHGNWHTEDIIFVNAYRYVYDERTKTHHIDGRYNPDVEIKFGVKTLLEKRNYGGIYS